MSGALCPTAAGSDELLTSATRADRPVSRVEIVVPLPEELSDTALVPAPGSGGMPMSPDELMSYAAPANFFTLGWKGGTSPEQAVRLQSGEEVKRDDVDSVGGVGGTRFVRVGRVLARGAGILTSVPLLSGSVHCAMHPLHVELGRPSSTYPGSAILSQVTCESGIQPIISPRSRPVLRWAGGKSILLPAIEGNLPHTWGRYFEPMAGGAALFFRRRPERATLGDVNADLMNFYEILKGDFPALSRALRPLKASRELYYAFRSGRPRTRLARAVRFAYLNRLAWNGLYRVNRSGEFNVPIGDRLPSSLWDFDELHEASKALSGTSLLTGDFAHVVRYARAGDFVFLDPPYPRGAVDAVGFNRYTKSFFATADHRRLSRVVSRLSDRGVYVMVLLADRRELRKLYSGMRCHTSTSKALIACNGNDRRSVRELMLVNY